jgi:hypothetical protein
LPLQSHRLKKYGGMTLNTKKGINAFRETLLFIYFTKFSSLREKKGFFSVKKGKIFFRLLIFSATEGRIINSQYGGVDF